MIKQYRRLGNLPNFTPFKRKAILIPPALKQRNELIKVSVTGNTNINSLMKRFVIISSHTSVKRVCPAGNCLYLIKKLLKSHGFHQFGSNKLCSLLVVYISVHYGAHHYRALINHVYSISSIADVMSRNRVYADVA